MLNVAQNMSDSNESGKSRLRLKEKLFERVNAPLAEGSTAPTDVYAMLEQNKIIAEAAAKPLEPVTKRSRRMRDYLITMIGGNGAVILAMGFLPKNPVL